MEPRIQYAKTKDWVSIAPRPELVTPLLQALEVDLDVARGPAAVLIATLMTPKGEVQLR